jgi:hypothetical protein
MQLRRLTSGKSLRGHRNGVQAKVFSSRRPPFPDGAHLQEGTQRGDYYPRPTPNLTRCTPPLRAEALSRQRPLRTRLSRCSFTPRLTTTALLKLLERRKLSGGQTRALRNFAAETKTIKDAVWSDHCRCKSTPDANRHAKSMTPVQCFSTTHDLLPVVPPGAPHVLDQTGSLGSKSQQPRQQNLEGSKSQGYRPTDLAMLLFSPSARACRPRSIDAICASTDPPAVGAFDPILPPKSISSTTRLASANSHRRGPRMCYLGPWR